MDIQQKKKLRAESLLIAVVLIWASNYPLAKYGIGVLGPSVFNSIRFLTAASTITLLFMARSGWKTIEPGDGFRLLRAGFVGNFLYQIAFIVGLSYTTAGNSAILLSTSPLWTLVFNMLLHKENITRQLLLGMGISLCGVVFIIVGSGKKIDFGGNALLGDIITLVAAALWGLNTNLQKPLLTRYSAIQLASTMIAVGAVGLTLIAIPPALSLDWTQIHWYHIAIAICSGGLSIAVANVFWSYGIQQLGPTYTANFSNMVPVLAFTLSVLTLHEEVNTIQYIGVPITLIGVWLARK